MGSYALPGTVIRQKVRDLLLALVVGGFGVVAALVAPHAATTEPARSGSS
ncbi:hypothetical protein ACFWFI_41550 [Streptomyces sp. NPDC060209]